MTASQNFKIKVDALFRASVDTRTTSTVAWVNHGASGFPLSGCNTVRLAHNPRVVLNRGVVLYTNGQALEKVNCLKSVLYRKLKVERCVGGVARAICCNDHCAC